MCPAVIVWESGKEKEKKKLKVIDKQTREFKYD